MPKLLGILGLNGFTFGTDFFQTIVAIMARAEVMSQRGHWDVLNPECDERDSENNEENRALTCYGYTIFDYLRQYDLSWIHSLEALKEQYLASAGVVIVKKSKKKRSLGKPDRFPPETVFEVMSYLDFETLLEATQVSRCWRDLAYRDSLWHNLLVAKYGLSAKTIVKKRRRKVENDCNPKEMFRLVFLSFLDLIRAEAMYKERPFIPASALGSGFL